MLKKSLSFFQDTSVIVQSTGLQDKMYTIMRHGQNSIPVVYTYEAVLVLKLTGIQIITNAPLTFVGALFFGYCRSITGNNAVGFVFNSISYKAIHYHDLCGLLKLFLTV